MRVFLINIRDPEFFTVAKGQRAKNGNIQIIGSPPIGIMTLSAVLKRAGHECLMFDQANPETPNKVIIERIQEQNPDIVGLSFLSTTSYSYAKTMAQEIRAANVKIPLAFGGTFATINADLIKLQCPEVDFVCRGDGEQLILDLVEHLDDPAKVNGVTWLKDGKIVRNPDRAIENDLDQWPFPDRESLALDFIKALPLDVPAVLSKKRFTVMQTSRGCPQSCVFCTIPEISKRRWRARSAQHVINELKHLQNHGYGVIYFVDDNFLLKSKRIEEICKGINDNNINIEWGCEGRVDSVVQHLFPVMVKAHCIMLMFGVESGSQKMLHRLDKKQTLSEIQEAIKDAKQAGVKLVHGFFVVGSPDETIEDMRATFKFVSKLRLDTFNFNRLCVYRGTPLWQEYVKRGLLNEETDWYKFFKCSEIDPTCLSGEVINQERMVGIRQLFFYKLRHYPLQTLRVLYRLVRNMPFRDILHLIIKPFLGNKRGPIKAELLSREV
ncbi:MAG: radical SAM protein [Candidatus Omnitrophota bacterium]